MKFGVFVASSIAVGLIAYQHQPTLFTFQSKPIETEKFSSQFAVQAQMLTYPQFAAVAQVISSANSLEILLPAESLFYKNSTAMSPQAEKQFAQLVTYLDSLNKDSKFEVTLVGVPDSDFNPKFRSTRVRKLASAINKAGIAEARIDKVWQVLLDQPNSRETASEARPSASSELAVNQYFSVRILPAK